MENEDQQPDYSALPKVILDELDGLNTALRRAALADQERLIDLREQRPSFRSTSSGAPPMVVPALVESLLEATPVVGATPVDEPEVEAVVVDEPEVEATPVVGATPLDEPEVEAVVVDEPEVEIAVVDDSVAEAIPDPATPWAELGVPRSEAATLQSPNLVLSALGGADPSLVPAGWHLGLAPRRPVTRSLRAQRWMRRNWPFVLASVLAAIAILAALMMIDGA